MNLFQHARAKQIEAESPLANRMRPRTLDEYVGQEHIIGHGRLLRRAIQADQLSSLIFYGPPGTGKTTLAMVIANSTSSHFITINAVLAGVKEIREAIAAADERRTLHNQRTTLFVDEVHRWNKAQQDALLPHVERGTLILIGATTENPYFEVNQALVSRSRIFQLRPLNSDDLYAIAAQTLSDAERGYGNLPVQVHSDALNHLVNVANGDARSLLNALELAVETTPPDPETGQIELTLAVAEESIQQKAVLYDKDGDVHYDTISAFIKSVRGSDPDAALYWLAKMIYAGEDPRFIFRRLAILAGEDIGLGDPQAASVVNSCWEIFTKIGLPEGLYPLAQATLYLATCPKSNSALGFFDALKAVEEAEAAKADVPNHLKDGNRDAKGFGHGRGYHYPHAYRDHWVAQQYLPNALQGRVFYQPSNQGYERHIRDDVARRREAQLAAMLEQAQDWLAGELGEVFTTSPENAQQAAWLQRTITSSGAFLTAVRDELLELARLQRHHLVLDLQAGTGLLTWELVRRTPEGGVWAIVPPGPTADALQHQSQFLPELTQPQLVASLADLPPELKFDRLVAREALNTAVSRSPDRLAEWRKRLTDDGVLVIAQTIPRASQRPADLIDWSEAEKGLHTAVRTAEAQLYHNPHNPQVNWDAADLTTALTTAGWEILHQAERTLTEERQVSASQLDRWFQPSPPNSQPTSPPYVHFLQAVGLTAEQIEQVAALYRRQLLATPLVWHTAVVFFIVRPTQASR